MRVTGIVVASGTGERFGRPGGKQLAPLAGSTVLGWAVRALDVARRVDTIVVVAHPEQVDTVQAMLSALPSVIHVVPGGITRQDSVFEGLAALPADVEVVVVHDGARPLVAPSLIDAAVEALDADVAGVVVGHPSYDTLKRVDEQGFVRSTEDRSRIWVAQTPQVFWRDVLVRAHGRARAAGVRGTDDASLVERLGGRIRMVEGPRDNIKITVPSDLVLAEAVLATREGQR